jgi:membrane protein implicated in regulation of membrane protease activity
MSAVLIWFLIGVVFLVAELLAPGFILAFFLVGSWTTALVLMLFQVSAAGQLLIFVSTSLLSLFLLRGLLIRVFRGEGAKSSDEEVDMPKIGKVGIVTRPIKPGIPGEVKAMGSFWKAVSDRDIEEGTPIVILRESAGDHLTLIVEPFVEEKQDD